MPKTIYFLHIERFKIQFSNFPKVTMKDNFSFIFKNNCKWFNSKGLGDDIVLNVSDNTVRFFALGDWGGLPVFPYRTIVEQNVALYMARRAKELNIHFQLTLGDNFYFNGVTNSSDKRFIVSFLQLNSFLQNKTVIFKSIFKFTSNENSKHSKTFLLRNL